jgi:hypothetical protein
MNPIFLLYPEVTMGHISTLKLHRLRYGELSHDEQATLRDHLAGCETCASRLSAQDNHRAAFELMPVPPAIAQATSSPGLWARLTRGWLIAPLLVAAAALLILSPEILKTERIKGNHGIEILVEDYGVLEQGEAIRPGDRIQLRIPPGEWVEVWVGDGESWLGSFPVQPSARWQLVPFSLEVDEAPGPERLVVLLANHTISEDEARDALSGESPGGIELEMITLPKEL